ncbi:MAG: TerB family tellurite resistance protein [Paraburkholderia sp.]|uniref:TerB family tellurite resistance protein n=1 Tax=Paraburkholderia sp. TaxID=1926495 RepID=UPI003C59E39F
MRTYKCDSPQAAARLVALALLADSHVGSNELKALEGAGLSDRLGLKAGEFQTIMQSLCEDLALAAHLNWGNLCKFNPELMEHLIAEIQDPQMRAEVMSLSRVAIHADRHVTEAEFTVLHAFASAWQMPAGWDVCHRGCTEPTHSQAR